jgi:hypothetical protein
VRVALSIALVVGSFLLGTARADEFITSKTLTPGYDIAEWKLLDVNADGSANMILVGADGSVKTWGKNGPVGNLKLAQPHRTLLAWANVMGAGKTPQLISMSPGGTVAFRPDAHGVFLPEAHPLATRARFDLRVNDPMFAGVVQDINQDGRLDLVVPGARHTEIWIREGDSFRRTARLEVEADRFDAMSANALSDDLIASFRVPQLHTKDINGDGRPDLLVRSGRVRAFHIQKEDGSFPTKPDVRLDLRIFKDTTPRGTLRPGRTISGGDRQRYETRDLDGDGIADYVIAHRRKVWVFHGTKGKPQFTQPTTILKVSDDITSMLIVKLDDDPYPDLLLFKVQVPSAAGIVAGLVAGLEIEADALGYASEKGRGFARSPKWRSTLTLKIPAIQKILKDPGKILDKIEETGKKFRMRSAADLDGDGIEDTLLMTEDGRRIEYWRAARKISQAERSIDFSKMIRKVAFEDKNRVWDIDRVLQFVSGMAEQRTEILTGGRKPDAVLELRPAEQFEFMDFSAADTDGDGKAELILRYAPGGGTHRPIFDIVRLK